MLLPSLAVLPASQILEGAGGGVRCHQAVRHPLVDQGGVGGHGTQQHGEASVQRLAYAAPRRGGSRQAAGDIFAIGRKCVCESKREAEPASVSGYLWWLRER